MKKEIIELLDQTYDTRLLGFIKSFLRHLIELNAIKQGDECNDKN